MPTTIPIIEFKAAACIFLVFKPDLGLFEPLNEKPYFYLDPHDLAEGDLALVWSGNHFGIIQVMQKLDYADPKVAEKVTNSLICPLGGGSTHYAAAKSHILKRQEELRHKRIQKRIKQELKDEEVDY